MKIITAVIVAFGLLISSVALAVFLSYRAVSSNNQNWCTVLELLTARKVPYPAHPKANPSRVADYRLYEDFKSLEGTFHC
jgi:hypothetical protein